MGKMYGVLNTADVRRNGGEYDNDNFEWFESNADAIDMANNAVREMLASGNYNDGDGFTVTLFDGGDAVENIAEYYIENETIYDAVERRAWGIDR